MTQQKLALFSVDVAICATAYIRAENAEAAAKLAGEAFAFPNDASTDADVPFGFQGGPGDIRTCGAAFERLLDTDLPAISLSPAMTFYGRSGGTALPFHARDLELKAGTPDDPLAKLHAIGDILQGVNGNSEPDAMAEALEQIAALANGASGANAEDWTRENSRAACAEGWDLFSLDVDPGRWQIQRLDDPGADEDLGFTEPQFATDMEALAHVRQRATYSDLHAKALKLHLVAHPEDGPPAPPRLAVTVDGHDADHPDATLGGDGQFPPFRLFVPDAQAYLVGDYPTRQAAQDEADRINQGDYAAPDAFPYYVGKAIAGAKPGEPATEEIGRFATLAEAEACIEARALTDPEGVAAGDYGIDGPEA